MLKTIFLSIILYTSVSLCAQQELPVFKLTRYDSTEIKGYYFFTANNFLIIYDKNINLVYYKPVQTALVFSLEHNNKMLFTTKNNVYLMDSTFNVVDSFACKGYLNDEHEGLILPSGHILLLGNENVTVDIKNNPELNKRWKYDSICLLTAVIQEQDMQHNVVFEWHAKNYFQPGDSDPFYDKRYNQPNWTHSNALELDADGNILLSSRNLNEIKNINRKDGSVIWRLGGKNNEFKFVNWTEPFYGQHDIKRIANGHFTLFDNGQNVVSHGARALEFELDEKNKIATLKWSYIYDSAMSSKGRGNVQRLPDENTLIGYGAPTKNNVCFVIVNPKGSKIMQVNGTLDVYRVTNYSSLPFKLHRPVIDCFDSAGVNYLDAGAGYKSYKWNTGDTTRIIKATKDGSYSVFVNYGDGGFISSEKLILVGLSKSCNNKPDSHKNKYNLNTIKK